MSLRTLVLGLTALVAVAAITSPAHAAELLESPWQLTGLPRPIRGFADVLPVCVPDVNRPEVATAARLAREASLYQALQILSPPGTFREERSEAAVRLFRSILEARTGLRAEGHAARAALGRGIRGFDDPASRVCGWTERARLALRSGFAAEAIGDLAIAARLLPDDAPGLAERIGFYRAESLWMLQREAEARDAFRALLPSSNPRIEWVARTHLESMASDSDWSRLRKQFARGGGLGIDMDPWAAHAGELAFQAGRVGDALYWFSSSQQVAGGDELAEIRKADALLLHGRLKRTRQILKRLELRAERPVARDIAALRLGQEGVGSKSKREQRLQRASRSETPRVAAQALLGLVEIHLASARPEEALDAIGRLRSLAPRGGVPGLDEATNAAVELAASTSDDCITTVRRLAGGRESWIRSVSSPKPLLRLGDCALELGLTSTAVDVYRALGRRFPDRLRPDLALRIANGSWELGQRSVVESMLAANERIAKTDSAPFEQRAPWMWLRAEIHLADGRHDDAFVLLEQLATSPETPLRERARVTETLTELPLRPGSEGEIGAALEAALRWDLDLSMGQRGRAWLRLADLREQAGRHDAARRAYRRASELLPAGGAKGRSLHALTATAEDRDERDTLLEQLAQGDVTGPWADLAKGELRLSHLRHLIDRSERNSQ